MSWNSDKTVLGATTTGSEWNDMVDVIEASQTHVGLTNNPHSVTKTQVGLGNVPNTDCTNADNISDGTTNAIITKTQETNFGTAYTHVTSNGSDHTYINQDVTTTATPTFSTITLSKNNGGDNIKVNDDAYIGDINTANCIGIKGVQDATLGGIVFGSGKDTNIYRGGANILKTDDTFETAGIKIGATTASSITTGSGDNDKFVTKGYVDDQIIAAGSGDVIGPASSVDNTITRFSGITGKVIQTSGVTINDSNVISGPQFNFSGGLSVGPDSILSAETAYLTFGASASRHVALQTWNDGSETTKIDLVDNNSSAAKYISMSTSNTERLRIDKDGLIDVKHSMKLPTGATINEFSTDGTLAGNSDTAVPTEKAVKTYVDSGLGSANTMPYTYKTANYTATTSDGVITCNGTFTVNTPATQKTGQVLTIKNWGTGVITINPDASDKIDGSTANITLNSQYSFIQILRADVDDWVIIGGGTYLS